MFMPSFSKGSILKHNMLDAMRDYPHVFQKVRYLEYGDGIISGFIVNSIEGHSFQISPGILKANNDIFISHEPLTIHQENEKHYVYLRIQENEMPDGKDIVMKCEQSITEDKVGIELFRYTKSAEMYEYKDVFEIFTMPMNRINQIYCKYAIIGGNTLHPNYYRLYSKAVLDCPNATPSDIAFAYQCLNGINNISIIQSYFNGVTSNEDVLKKMKTALERMNASIITQEMKPETKDISRKMIIS